MHHDRHGYPHNQRTLNGADGNALTGAVLTAKAFNIGLPGPGDYIVSIGIIFFAFSTAISWSYYGDRCVDYLNPLPLREKGKNCYELRGKTSSFNKQQAIL